MFWKAAANDRADIVKLHGFNFKSELIIWVIDVEPFAN